MTLKPIGPLLVTFWIASIAVGSERNHPFLLATQATFREARARAKRVAWARKALDKIVADADAALARPVDIPNRGGQWPHWYVCKKDGTRLETASPTRHVCPTCKAVYTGDPYDAVPIMHQHNNNSKAMRTLAMAWQLTGQSRYADRVVEMLLGYTDKYPGYAMHNRHGAVKGVGAKFTQRFAGGARIGAQTLDEAVWLIPVVQAYDMVWSRLTPGQRARIAEELLRPSAETCLGQAMGVHNIQCWKNSAVGLVGLVLDDSRSIRTAVDQPTMGFRAQIAKGITDDGLWYEGSLGYHAYTMSALWPLAVGASNAGIDLFTDRYRRLYEAPIRLALPDGSSPGFNDSAGGTVQALAADYELAYARWQLPMFGRLLRSGERAHWQALLWGPAKLPSGPLLPATSDNLPAAGFAVLRTSLGNDRVDAVAVRYGRHGGGHGHPDKLNIVIHGAGELLAPDPGSIIYGAPLHGQWYRATIAHNTVCVDQINQLGVAGKLEDWKARKVSTRLVASVDGTTKGVRMRRSLTLRGKRAAQQSVLTDKFEVTADKPHTYDWAFHVRGRLETNLRLSDHPEPLGTRNGYQHISQVRQADTDRSFTVTWTQGRARLTLKMKGERGTTVFVGQGIGRSPTAKVPMVIVRRKARSTIYEATMTIDRAR